MAAVAQECSEVAEDLSLIERHNAFAAIRALSFYSANFQTWAILKRLAKAMQKAADDVDLEAQNIDHVYEAEHAFNQACYDAAANTNLEGLAGLLDERNMGLFQTLILQWHNYM